MSATALTAIEKSRREVYNKMTPETKKIADSIASRRMTGQKLAVMINYDIGLEVGQVLGDEAKYGAHAVDQLAAYAFPGSPGGSTRLYNLRTFASAFERKFVESWTDKPMSNGESLTVSHWFELMKIEDTKLLPKILESILKESKSATELEAEIRAGQAGNTKNARQGGRRPSVPDNPVLALQRSAQLANTFNRFDNEAMAKAFSRFEDISPDKVDSALLKRAQDADATFEQTEKAIGKSRTKLGKVIERFKRIVEKQAATDKTAKAEKATEKKAPPQTAKLNKLAAKKKAKS